MFHALLFNFNLSPGLGLGTMAGQFVFFAAVLVIVQVFQEWKKDTFVLLRMPVFAQLSFAALIISLILTFGDFSNRPFIYFQF